MHERAITWLLFHVDLCEFFNKYLLFQLMGEMAYWGDFKRCMEVQTAADTERPPRSN